MNYTDQNVPILCGECRFVSDGLKEMEAHIFSAHEAYTPKEALEFAALWMEDAYVRLEETHAA